MLPKVVKDDETNCFVAVHRIDVGFGIDLLPGNETNNGPGKCLNP